MARLISEAAPHTRLPSVRALMTRFGVSQSTVTTAISRLEHQGLLYRKQGSGIFSAAAQSSRPYLLLIDSATAISPSSFWSSLVHAFRSFYADSPGQLEIRFTRMISREDPREPAENFLGQSLANAISAQGFAGVYAICLSDQVLRFVHENELPCVGFGCAARYHIHMSYLEGCQLAIGALARTGCRTIALYKPNHVSSREVFVAGLRAHGLTEVVMTTPDIDQTTPIAPGYDTTIEQGFRSAIAGFGPTSERSNWPDGVIILDDMFTQGYVMGLQSLGLEVGKDVQIASHVNEESPSLLAWKQRIIQISFRIHDIASVMHVGMNAVVRGEEPSDLWEHATWSSGPGGPFRIAMLPPTLITPEKHRHQREV